MSANETYRALVAALVAQAGGPLADAIAEGAEPLDEAVAGADGPVAEAVAEALAPGPSGPAAGTGAPLVTTPGAGPAPMFLAEVDDIDKSAVMGLLAFVPSPDGSSLRAFERKMGGWVEAPEYVRKVRGLTPPPLVELDRETLIQVVQQMDEYDMGTGGGEDDE